jgi:exonuclease SbcC
VEFGDGITVFEGDIGSGKSTILLAIEFALFGLGDTDSAHLLRHGAREGEVELSIDVGGRPVRLLRTLKRKRKKAGVDKCIIEDDGEVTELTSADMKPRVLGLLGYNENPDPKAKSDIFRFGVYTPQEDMRTILDTRSRMREQRKETIRRALGIQEYRVARDNLGIVASEVNARTREHAALAVGIDEAEERVRLAHLEREGEVIKREQIKEALKGAEEREREAAERRRSLEERQGLIAEGTRQVEALRTEVERARGELKVAEARASSVRKERERLEGLSQRVDELKDLPERVADMDGLALRIEELRTKHGEAVRRRSELEVELKRSRGARDLLEGLSKELEGLGDPASEREAFETELQDVSKRLTRLERARTRAQAKLEELSTDLEGLTSLEGSAECPRCHQELTPEHLEELLEKDRAEGERLEATIDELRTGVEGLETERTALESKLREIAETEKRRAVLEERIGTTENDASRVDELSAAIEEQAVEGLARELEETRAGLDEGKHRELLELDAERKDLLRRLEAGPGLERELATLEDVEGSARDTLERAEGKLETAETVLSREAEGFDAKELERARSDHDEANLALGGLRSDLADREERIGLADRRFLERGNELAQLQLHLMSAESHEEVNRWLTQCLRPALEEIELKVLSLMHDEMDALTRSWFERLVEDPDLDIEVDEEFVPTVTQQGFGISVEALSGGERTAVAFAYRLALNGLVQRIAVHGHANLLMLDEPTDGFSREQVVRMGGVLRDLGADQVVIVSHDRELRAFANHVYVVHKSGGASQVAPVG